MRLSEEHVKMINELTESIHAYNKQVGWWDGMNPRDPLVFTNKACLIHSEVSESVEGERKGLKDDKLPHREMAEVELVDVLIRTFDLGGSRGYRLGDAMAEKMAYNDQRADHKRENRAAEGGKKY